MKPLRKYCVVGPGAADRDIVLYVVRAKSRQRVEKTLGSEVAEHSIIRPCSEKDEAEFKSRGKHVITMERRPSGQIVFHIERLPKVKR